jgi:hypothetical protein
MWGCRCSVAPRPGSGWSDIALLLLSSRRLFLASRGVGVPPSAHVPRSRPPGRALLLYFAAGVPPPLGLPAGWFVAGGEGAMSRVGESFGAPSVYPSAGRAGRLGPRAERSKGGAIGPWPMAGDMSAAIGPKRPASRGASPKRRASRGGSQAKPASRCKQVLMFRRQAPQPRHRMPSQPSTHIQRPTA